MSVAITKGRVAANEVEVISTPKVRSNKRPILFAHGYATSNGGVGVLSQGSYGSIFEHLCRLNTVVMSADLGGNLWGNDTVAARIESYRQLAVTLGARSDKLIIVGASMGFLNGYGYARKNPGKLAGLFGIAPACSLQDIRANNRSDTASINTALGLTAGATLPAMYDPTQTPLTLKGVPGKLYYGTADAAVLPATVTTLATALGWQAKSIDTSNIHLSDAQLANFPHTELATLITALL